jgi:hypothetical protein
MRATAFIYNLSKKKGKEKTYLIRKIFGYKDKSNHGKYQYERKGILTPYILEKWGQSVIITEDSNTSIVRRILKEHQIPHETKKLQLID